MTHKRAIWRNLTNTYEVGESPARSSLARIPRSFAISLAPLLAPMRVSRMTWNIAKPDIREAWNPENDELLHLVHHMRLEKASIDFPQSFENPTSWRKHSEARPMGSRPPNAKLGIGYHDVDGGWLIKEVLKDSVASTAGLAVGDLIQTINSAPARKFSAKQLHKLLTDDSVILGILSQDGSQRIIRVERIAY